MYVHVYCSSTNENVDITFTVVFLLSAYCTAYVNVYVTTYLTAYLLPPYPQDRQ